MQKLSSLYIINLFTDGFPSGQRGQTVNLLAMPSKVRILLHPLLLQSIFALEFFCHTPKRFESFSIHYILNSQVKIPGSFLYGFSLFKMSTQRVGILNYNPPASRVVTHCYTQKSPFRTIIEVSSHYLRKER